MTVDAIQVDVVSDVVCPWCFLGKRRLEQALTLVPDLAVAVRWRPYRLDPTIPPEGIDRALYIARKFGGPEGVAAAHAELVRLGKAERIDFRFDRISRSPSSVDAHRLVRWAEPAGLQETVVERLFRAYFSEGIDVGDRAELARIAGEAGLDFVAIARRLESDEDRVAVEAEVAHAYRLGISGVPCFIVGRKYAVMGAQPAEVIADAIRTFADERMAEDAVGAA